MKNLKSKGIIIFSLLVFLFTTACTDCSSSLLNALANSSSSNYSSFANNSSEVSASESSSEIASSTSESTDTTTSEMSSQAITWDKSQQGDDQSSVMDMIYYSINDLIRFFGNGNQYKIQDVGTVDKSFILTFDSLPNFYFLMKPLDDLSGPDMGAYPDAVAFDLKDPSSDAKITSKAILGMTRAEMEKTLNYKINFSINEEDLSSYVGKLDAGDLHYVWFAKSDSMDTPLTTGYIQRMTDEELIAAYPEINSPASSQPIQNSAPATYVINDNIDFYVSLHKQSSDSTERGNADYFGKIDAMYEIGIVEYYGLSLWEVKTQTEFLDDYPDATVDYYKTLLKHFNVKPNDSFVMNQKYSITNP